VAMLFAGAISDAWGRKTIMSASLLASGLLFAWRLYHLPLLPAPQSPGAEPSLP
jgi:MFS family permease